MKKAWGFVWVSVGCVVAGCGGSSGAGGSVIPPAGDAPFAYGNFSGRSAATNPPVTTAAQATVATGFTGVFNSLKLRDQNLTLQDTRLAITSNITGSGDLYTINLDGSKPYRLTNTFSVQESQPAWSPQGNKIAVTGAQPSLDRDIYLYRTDGTFLSRVTNTPGSSEYNPSFSPDGSKLVFERDVSPTQLVIYNISSATETVPDMGGDAYAPAWSSKNQIAFLSYRNGTSQVYIGNPDGSNVQLSQASIYPVYDRPAWSPNGETLYYIQVNSGTSTIIARQSLFFSTAYTPIYSTTDTITSLTVSPDGNWVAFDDNSAIEEVPASGGSASTLYASPYYTPTVAWGPLIYDRLIVGSGGLLASSAAGFIYSDAAGQTQSVLAFNCVTPSSVVMHALTGIGGTEDSLIFSVDADTINLMSYANAPVWNAAYVILGGTSTPSANGALISIGAIDGQVNAVLPYNGSRGLDSKPTVTRQGSDYVFTGTFLSATDKTGKNVAPAGASRVVLDPKTGLLTAG